MITNVGTTDRIIRAILGFTLFYLAFFSGLPFFSPVGIQLATAALGGVMLFTAASRKCLLYRIFGIKTCKI